MPEKVNDIHRDDLIRRANKLLAEKPRALVFIKWTCPGCGERVTADNPNTPCLGNRHTEKADGSPCGVTHYGEYLGMMVVIPE